MELRSQLHSEEASARAALARQLLRDAQRPLSTLNTFGAMLTPRLEDGDIDKDMAEGIMLQVGLGTRHRCSATSVGAVTADHACSDTPSAVCDVSCRGRAPC